MRYAFILGFFVGVAVVAWINLKSPDLDRSEAEQQTLFDRHAYERWVRGLPPLVLDENLTTVARSRAFSMALADEIIQSAPRENLEVSDDGETTENRMLAFLACEPCRGLILDPELTHIGIAEAVSGSGRRYTAVVFD